MYKSLPALMLAAFLVPVMPEAATAKPPDLPLQKEIVCRSAEVGRIPTSDLEDSLGIGMLQGGGDQAQSNNAGVDQSSQRFSYLGAGLLPVITTCNNYVQAMMCFKGQ
jgi:hypothetical protein